jgi:hypothetical protein
MENVPLDIAVDYKIKVISVDTAAQQPRAVVDVRNTRYQVTYRAPHNAPPLRDGQFLSVVAQDMAMMVTVQPVNERYELDDVRYQLYDWQPL